MKILNYTLYDMLDLYKYIKLWQALIIIIIVSCAFTVYRRSYYKDYIKRKRNK